MPQTFSADTKWVISKAIEWKERWKTRSTPVAVEIAEVLVTSVIEMKIKLDKAEGEIARLEAMVEDLQSENNQLTYDLSVMGRD